MELFEELNLLLVETFNIIIKEEELALKTMAGIGLSLSEYHLIEAVEKLPAGVKNSTGVAAALGLSLPTVTVAIKKLEAKGCVQKSKSLDDGRIMDIVLTEKGKEVLLHHQMFHRHMVHQMISQLNSDEQRVLSRAISKINSFFKHSRALVCGAQT